MRIDFQFRASSDHTWEQTITRPSVIMPPPPPVPPKPNTEQSKTQDTQASGGERKRVRKSRWE